MQQGTRPLGRPSSWNRVRLTLALVAVAVLAITGIAWRGMDSLVGSIERIGGLGLGGKSDGATDILLVGVDSRTDAHGNPLSARERALLHAGEDDAGINTDTIVLIRVPADGRSATAVSIPRDTYVDIPGHGRGKINSAYGQARTAAASSLRGSGTSPEDTEKQAEQAGRKALVQSVANLTGVTVDHYAEIGLLGFVLLTDAVGGVDVCLNQPVSEPLSGANFPAGPQRLDGPHALSFVRQRHELPRGDIDRIVRQQVFMAQLVHQVLSAKTLSNPTRLRELFDAAGRTVVLDDGWDALAFTQQLQDLSAGQVTFGTIPVADLNGMTDEGESVVRVDPTAVHRYIAELAGQQSTGEHRPAAGNVHKTVSPLEAPDPTGITVDVFNATTHAGWAGSVSRELARQGYTTGQVGNYTGHNTLAGTRVVAATQRDRQAQTIASLLGGVPVQADRSVPPGEIHVILADDYNGPASGSTSPSTTATPVPPSTRIGADHDRAPCVD